MENISGKDGPAPRSPEEGELSALNALEREPVTDLRPEPGQENADALVIYPRSRYLAARRGEMSREDFARDLVRHVREQTASSRGAAG